ncbi:MAG: hypothetical protein ABIG28_02225 [archaeon]
MNKRGLGKISRIILTIAVIATIIFFLILVLNKDTTGKGPRQWIVDNSPNFTKNFTEDFLLKGKSGAFFDYTIGTTQDILGFNEGGWSFISDLLKGALVGFWLWIIFIIAKAEKIFRKFTFIKASYGGYLKRLNNSWLSFVGGAIWKIIPIAVGYAVLMQIPILNSFIKIITFETLFNFSTNAFANWFLTSFIIAFYIGFLPATIQAYTRYKIKRGYEEAIIREKYRGKIVDAMSQER